MMRIGLVWAASLLTACGSSTHDIWGLVHGDVTVTTSGEVAGVLVWEFFDGDGKPTADHHRCGRVLEVTGSTDAACTDCAVAARLEVHDVEHDCPAGEGTSEALAAMDRLWVRPAKGAPSGDYPDASWSWALGWSGGEPEPEGVAWDEGMEFGEPPADPSTLLGRRVRLTPTRARGFSTADLADSPAE